MAMSRRKDEPLLSHARSHIASASSGYAGKRAEIRTDAGETVPRGSRPVLPMRMPTGQEPRGT